MINSYIIMNTYMNMKKICPSGHYVQHFQDYKEAHTGHYNQRSVFRYLCKWTEEVEVLIKYRHLAYPMEVQQVQ